MVYVSNCDFLLDFLNSKKGRYIPVYASAVYEQNKLLKAAGVEPINLKSVIIGNGITDPYR
jgi:cathepsin A (carboxypeptidase C)